MIKYRVLLLLLLVVMASSCKKDDGEMSAVVGDESSDKISFDLSSAVWSRGDNVDDLSDIINNQMDVYSCATYGTTWGSASSDDISVYFTSDISTPFALTIDNTNGECSYDGATRYWPVDEDNRLTFIACYPAGELDCSTNSTTGKPELKFTQHSYAGQNNDLLVAAECDQTINDGTVDFELEHILTKLSLAVTLKGSLNSDGVAYIPTGANEEDCDIYEVNDITIYNLYENATVEIDASGAISWNLDKSSVVSHTATQGVTLLDVDNSSAILTTTTQSVMADDKAIFVLPQDLGTTLRGTDAAPMAEIRIRRKFYANESDYNNGIFTQMTYESEKIEILAPTGQTAWNKGQHIQLNFTFDIGNLADYSTPLTLSSEVLKWSLTSVVADIHSNIYIYSSTNNITVSSEDDYGEFMICTNYDYNMRVPHHREEADGDITSSRGFLFYTDDFNNTEDVYYIDEKIINEKTHRGFMPTLLTGDGGEQVVYVTKSNIADYELNHPSTVDPSAVETYGSNGFGYDINPETGLYRLLYYHPTTKTITPFDYINITEDNYHEIDLSSFESNNTVYFKIIIGDIDGEATTYSDSNPYQFDFSVKRSTRDEEGLYVSSIIETETNESYGINKMLIDAVYILRLSIDSDHLNDIGGTFDDAVGAEMISNGGGMMSFIFPVTLTTATTN